MVSNPRPVARGARGGTARLRVRVLADELASVPGNRNALGTFRERRIRRCGNDPRERAGVDYQHRTPTRSEGSAYHQIDGPERAPECQRFAPRLAT